MKVYFIRRMTICSIFLHQQKITRFFIHGSCINIPISFEGMKGKTANIKKTDSLGAIVITCLTNFYDIQNSGQKTSKIE